MTDKMKSFVKGILLGLFGHPLPQEEKEPVAYLYNGVRLPKLPEWDREKYFAYITFIPAESANEGKDIYQLVLSEGEPTWVKGGNIARLDLESWFDRIGYYYTNGEWVTADKLYLIHKVNTYSNGVAHELVWANTDVPNYDGSLLVAKSDPVPVYE